MESDMDDEASVAVAQPRMVYPNTMSGVKIASSQKTTGLFGNMASTSTTVPVSGSNALPVGLTNPLPQQGTSLFGNIPVSTMTAPMVGPSATAMGPTNAATLGISNNQAQTPDMMPLLGARSAPAKFKGKHDSVKRFICQYKQMCAVYNVPGPERCKQIIDYCSTAVTHFIESLDSFVDRKWDLLEEDILTYYDAELSES